MSYIIAVAKTGHDVSLESDPNVFIFHSNYNTFKIIKTGVVRLELVTGDGQLFYVPHRLNFTPLVTAFAKEFGYDRVFPPNSGNVAVWSPKAGIIGTGVAFVSVSSDANNIILKFNSTYGETVWVRYYCLETI